MKGRCEQAVIAIAQQTGVVGVWCSAVVMRCDAMRSGRQNPAALVRPQGRDVGRGWKNGRSRRPSSNRGGAATLGQDGGKGIGSDSGAARRAAGRVHRMGGACKGQGAVLFSGHALMRQTVITKQRNGGQVNGQRGKGSGQARGSAAGSSRQDSRRARCAWGQGSCLAVQAFLQPPSRPAWCFLTPAPTPWQQLRGCSPGQGERSLLGASAPAFTRPRHHSSSDTSAPSQ